MLNKLIKRVILTSLFSILGGSFLFAEQIAVSDFKYLNSNDNSTIIDPVEAQDLLNVDISPSGKSVKKRPGFGLYKNVFATSSGVHGGYHFFDATGNDVQIWGSSVSVKTVVADGTPNTIVSSMTVNSTIDCTDTQGSAYCVNSSRDFYIRTNGTTLTQWYTSPLGTMVEATPDRVVVAGVAASPNSLFVSQSNTFTNFVTGVNATDPFTEVIASPGSHLTHIRWGCQKLLWWKDQSFGYFDFDDQYNAQVKIVSDNIGTVDNTSAVDPGGNVWFRGQDGHTYRYDCSGLEKMTVDITPQIQSSGRRTTNSWTQTTSSDFNSGAIEFNGNTVSLSTSIVSGDIIRSSITLVDTTSADFGLATYDGGIDSTTVSNAITLKTYLADTFSSMSNWTQACGTTNASGGEADMTSSVTIMQKAAECTPTGHFIEQFDFHDTDTIGRAEHLHLIISTSTGQGDVNGGYVVTVFAEDSPSQFELYLSTTGANTGYWSDGSGPGACSSWGNLNFEAFYISSATIGAYDTATHTIKFVRDNTSGSMQVYWDGVLKLSNTHNFSTPSTFKNIGFSATQAPANGHWKIDNVSLVARQGNINSRVFDTAFSTPTWGTFTANTSGTGSFAHAVRTSSASADSYVADSAITSGSNITSSKRRYIVYSSTLATTAVTSLPQITDVTIVAASTGTFYSAWKNAPNFTAWGTFNPTFSNGDGTHTFYVRASTSPQSVLNTTVTWVSQPANSQVATSTVGVYFQIRDDFFLSVASQTPTLNDFTVNWFEGAASDQAYMLYFDNAIWESVAYGVGISSNNYIFRRDLINDGWGLYYFGANGMLIQGNRLYFGSVTNGDVYQFGSGTSDNGSAINAYWKSKDFTGGDPFLQTQLSNIDTFAKKNQSNTLTTTYSLDTSTTTTSYTIALSTNTAQFIQNRKLLPSGKLGYTFNIQYGDQTTTSAWELLGFRIGYTQLPYRPSQ